MVFITAALLVSMLYPTIALKRHTMYIWRSHQMPGRRGGLWAPTKLLLMGVAAQAYTSDIYRVWIVTPCAPNLLPSVLSALHLLITEYSRRIPVGIRDISSPRPRGAVDRYYDPLSDAFGGTPKILALSEGTIVRFW